MEVSVILMVEVSAVTVPVVQAQTVPVPVSVQVDEPPVHVAEPKATQSDEVQVWSLVSKVPEVRVMRFVLTQESCKVYEPPSASIAIGAVTVAPALVIVCALRPMNVLFDVPVNVNPLASVKFPNKNFP